VRTISIVLVMILVGVLMVRLLLTSGNGAPPARWEADVRDCRRMASTGNGNFDRFKDSDLASLSIRD
jgi:hypothetical protein